ncbi:HNH endonuclease signature motif containing protein [Pseudonocardia endophytica]|uniref:HNH endonuclease signature motif containing protein n=1 Tax=Pseudonocardia endophytica TaxID=401976 RepID=UPI00104551E1|nr:HNH endonuclease signature motif containing protein [Pseudonocardia endophytica]
MFDAVATALDAVSAPRDSLDQRAAVERQAEALGELCAFALDHASSAVVPETGGRRPVISVLITLKDLQDRARAAVLDFGGTITPGSLRMLACDAGIVPVVMNGAGQPLDVGRVRRTIPDGLRRAVTARDRGCAHPGCERPPSWCEIHHVTPWEHGGQTTLGNLVMLCKIHHRQIHHTDWLVRIRDGLPEFVPPRWIDPEQRPRRQPALVDVA